jgi:O-antigen ligase
MWLRSGNLTTPRVVDVDFALQYSSFYDIGHQLLFYALFVLAAVYCYNKGGINLTLWLIILGYTIAFMARNTMQLDELKVGYNLSPGFVLFSLVPFLFLGRLQDNKKTGIFIHIFFWLCTIWTFLIGARTAMFSMLIFYGCMAAWPLISCNKKIYYTTFVGTLMFIFGIVTTYLLIIISGLAENLETLSVAIFDKSLFTRFKLWYFLSQIIAERPILGFGTENASTSFIAPKILFPLRENLSAHSTYLEILIRLGFVGLILYLCVLFGIWKILWQGRGENAVRVAGSFLIASLFFMSTGEYLIFGMELRSAFGWIILGIGAGACLQNKNRVNCTLK